MTYLQRILNIVSQLDESEQRQVYDAIASQNDIKISKEQVLEALNDMDEDKQRYIARNVEVDFINAVVDQRVKKWAKSDLFGFCQDAGINVAFLCFAETMQAAANCETLESNFDRIDQVEFEKFLDQYKL